MTKIAYIQSIGGASGDMLLGALVDAGLPLHTLKSELAKLPIDAFEIHAEQQSRCEIRGTHLSVRPLATKRHSPAALLAAVRESALAPAVVEPASAVLEALWRAEARVHGGSTESLHLEELGTIDTLVDVVGFCIGLREFGIESVYAAPLVLGEASAPRRPGGYSNPAPATLELIAAAAAPVAADNAVHQAAGELTTPTGAALIATLSEFRRPAMAVQAVGVGLGAKDPPAFPNVLRLWLGASADVGGSPTYPEPGDAEAAAALFQSARVTLLETNLDDASGLVMGYVQERLFALGALDVWHTPVQMKKNRPGLVLSVLVPADLEQAAVDLMMRETPTLGIRTRRVDRYVAERRSVSLNTELGQITVKVKYLDGAAFSVAPEPDDCHRLAIATGLSFQEVYARAAISARQQLLG